MRLLNIDLHISVVRDVKDILAQFNMKVDDSRSWSGHCRLVNKKPWLSKYINASNWRQAVQDEDVVQNFVRHYRKTFDTYDGFLVTHTPVLVKLFVSFGKPILVVNSCRFDQPYCWQDNFSNGHSIVGNLLNSQNVKVISNNLADQEYLKMYGRVDSEYIPSYCEYAKPNHTQQPNANVYYYYGAKPPTTSASSISITHFPVNYTFEQLGSARAIVCIPTEISTMTMFELQHLGVPLLVPTKSFWKTLIDTKFILLQSDYNLHLPLGKDFWVDRSDYYQDFPYVYFDSWVELYQRLQQTFTVQKIQMQNWKFNRKQNILKKWKPVTEWIKQFKMNNQTIFEHIYETKKWGADGLGDGSTPELMQPYLGFLSRLVTAWNFQSVADVGCGCGTLTANLCRHLDVEYTGYDIVPSLPIHRSYNFVHLDAVNEPEKIKHCDLLILKDVAHHLPNEIVSKLLPKLLLRCRFMLLVTDAIVSSNPTPNIQMGEDRIFTGPKQYPLNCIPMFEIFQFGKCKKVYLIKNND